MAVTSAKPKVGGAIYTAPVGTALPTDATTALNEAFKCLGAVSDAGLKNNISRTTQDTKAWGGTVVDSSQTEFKDEFTYELMDATDENVLKSVFGDANVTKTADAITIKVNAKELNEMSWVVDMVLKNGTLKRIVIPKGKVTAVGEISYVDNDTIGYACTMTTFPDATENNHYEYIN